MGGGGNSGIRFKRHREEFYKSLNMTSHFLFFGTHDLCLLFKFVSSKTLPSNFKRVLDDAPLQGLH